jgi:tetratricopeptide (TPR) repeat protein
MKSLPGGTTPHEHPQALPYGDLSFTVGWYLALAEDWELAAHNYLGAEAIYRSLGRPRERSDALNNAGVAMVEAGRPLAAAASLRSAIELRTQQGSPVRAATSSYNLARALADAGRLGRALRAYEEAAGSYREAGLEREALETRIERLALLARDQQAVAFERAGAELLLLLQQPTQPSEVESLASLWFEIGRGRHGLGLCEQALSAYVQSVTLWRQLSRRLEEAQVLYSMALPYVSLLRFSQAHQTLVEALVIAVELGDSSSILAIRSQLRELEGLLRARGDEIPSIPEDLRQWLEPAQGGGP